jgi:uncharacterized membrane protein
MIAAFCNWLSNTPISLTIQNVSWVIPTVQTVHILAIATVMASVVMLDFRVLGLAGRSQSIPDVAHRFLPWIWCAVVVLLCTGSILIIGEPARDLLNNVFWTKMSLLVCALLITGLFQYTVDHRLKFWDGQRAIARVAAVASLVCWIGIVAAGRWIAYWEHG